MSVALNSILEATRGADSVKIIERVAETLIDAAQALEATWVMLSFGKSARTPVGQFWSCYCLENKEQEHILQRGPFRLLDEPPAEAGILSEDELTRLAPDTLRALFPSGALYVPVWAAAGVDFEGRPAAALVLDVALDATAHHTSLVACQIALSIAVGFSIHADADERTRESSLFPLIGRIESARTRRESCQAVLALLYAFVPYEAGVLYLLDQDPGRNEYLLFGASRNENSNELFRSYYSRADLGFTWDVARDQIPRAGSRADIPASARHLNDSALSHVASRHDAWMVVPLSAHDDTRAVAHLEGVRYYEGASLPDLEIMRRLGARIGSSLDRNLGSLPADHGYASIATVDALRRIVRVRGPERRVRFEGFVRTLFANLDGVVAVTIDSRDIPQIDGLFLLTDDAQRFVIEVKTPDEDEHSLGIDAIRQVASQMTAVGASHGLLVTTARFRSRVADSTLSRDSVTVLDGNRLERFCVLADDEKKRLLSGWLTDSTPGARLATF